MVTISCILVNTHINKHQSTVAVIGPEVEALGVEPLLLLGCLPWLRGYL